MRLGLEERLRRYAHTLDQAIDRQAPETPVEELDEPTAPPRSRRPLLLLAAVVLATAIVAVGLAIAAEDTADDLATGAAMPPDRLALDPSTGGWEIVGVSDEVGPQIASPDRHLLSSHVLLEYASTPPPDEAPTWLGITVLGIDPIAGAEARDRLAWPTDESDVTVRGRQATSAGEHAGYARLAWWERDDLLVVINVEMPTDAAPGALALATAAAEDLVELTADEWHELVRAAAEPNGHASLDDLPGYGLPPENEDWVMLSASARPGATPSRQLAQATIERGVPTPRELTVITQRAATQRPTAREGQRVPRPLVAAAEDLIDVQESTPVTIRGRIAWLQRQDGNDVLVVWEPHDGVVVSAIVSGTIPPRDVEVVELLDQVVALSPEQWAGIVTSLEEERAAVRAGEGDRPQATTAPVTTDAEGGTP